MCPEIEWPLFCRDPNRAIVFRLELFQLIVLLLKKWSCWPSSATWMMFMCLKKWCSRNKLFMIICLSYIDFVLFSGKIWTCKLPNTIQTNSTNRQSVSTFGLCVKIFQLVLSWKRYEVVNYQARETKKRHQVRNNLEFGERSIWI